MKNLFGADLREHAIFTLHSLLENNVENQQLVRDLKPIRDSDDNGKLRGLNDLKDIL